MTTPSSYEWCFSRMRDASSDKWVDEAGVQRPEDPIGFLEDVLQAAYKWVGDNLAKSDKVAKSQGKDEPGWGWRWSLSGCQAVVVRNQWGEASQCGTPIRRFSRDQAAPACHHHYYLFIDFTPVLREAIRKLKNRDKSRGGEVISETLHVPHREPRAEPVALYMMALKDRVKIGISNNPTRRRRTLSNQAGADISLEKVVWFQDRETAAEVESSMHDKFSDIRILGEWFHRDEMIDRSIGELEALSVR